MKILKVVHSFVPYTMAGTEVYSYKLSKELSAKNRVSVFFRVNMPEEKEYALRHSELDGLELYAINNTFRLCNSFKDIYSNNSIDNKFGELLDRVKPDIVHIHHLLFLSCGVVREIKRRNIPMIYTLHDYWLICHRGQLIKDDMSVCEGGPSVGCRDCLKYLLGIRRRSLALYNMVKRKLHPSFLMLLKKAHFFLANRGDKPSSELQDMKDCKRDVLSKIDLFLGPSRFIIDKFIQYGLPEEKILYSPYGLECNGSSARHSVSAALRIGYLGTLLPMKGVDLLINAFKKIENNNIRLSIYGRRFAYSGFESYPLLLEKLAGDDKRVRLAGGYDNKDIRKILADIDLLVVPSIWQENSPLVIQEAFLSNTPVLASRIGGIPELVRDGSNGLLFNPTDTMDLKEKLEYIINNPAVLEKFRQNIPKVKSIAENAEEMEKIYSQLIA